MTEKEIQAKLLYKFKQHKYKFINTHFFSSEQDWISFLSSGYCWEIEVKVSKADFLRDFKKKKHTLMKAVYKAKNKTDLDKEVPNRFYFCAPEGMLDVKDIPAYAGLWEYNPKFRSLRKIKEAPLLHKSKLRPERLFRKLYYEYERLLVARLSKVTS